MCVLEDSTYLRCVDALNSCNAFDALETRATLALVEWPKARRDKAQLLNLDKCQFSRAENPCRRKPQRFKLGVYWMGVWRTVIPVAIQRCVGPIEPVAEVDLDADRDGVKSTAHDRERQAALLSVLLGTYGREPSYAAAFDVFKAAAVLCWMEFQPHEGAVAKGRA